MRGRRDRLGARRGESLFSLILPRFLKSESVGILAQMKAKPGKEAAVEAFLKEALPLEEDCPGRRSSRNPAKTGPHLARSDQDGHFKA